MAIILTPVRPVTDEELLELSRRNPGYQFERSAKGELVVTPTGGEAGRLEQELSLQLGVWTKRDGRGIAFSPSTGFRLPDGSLLSPDASWMQRDRWEALTAEERQGFAPVCPDAVFEIRSESDRLSDLQAKMAAYLRNGARLAVLIDPQGRTVEVYRPGAQARAFRDARTVTFEPELPGFALDLGAIYP
jgi:Uma2 family endonuclease